MAEYIFIREKRIIADNDDEAREKLEEALSQELLDFPEQEWDLAGREGWLQEWVEF
jgi:hypothetical protein